MPAWWRKTGPCPVGESTSNRVIMARRLNTDEAQVFAMGMSVDRRSLDSDAEVVLRSLLEGRDDDDLKSAPEPWFSDELTEPSAS